LTLGSDLSGVVEAVGPKVTAFEPNGPVFGVTNSRFTGANAEFAVASAGMIVNKPARLTDIDAASVPVVAVTAWQALFEQAHVTRGHAYAVQFAHQAGLRVIATVGAGNTAYVRSLGADDVIDFRAEGFEDKATAIDAVIDLVGEEIQRRSFSVLKEGGILVSAVSPPDRSSAERRGVQAMFFLVNVTTLDLVRVAEMIDAGDLITNVGAILPLADIRTAHEMLEGSRPHPRGKIVLRISA
jgi:NADPH:quinone reductase-like Zn-dependent oxidoreductase